LSEADAIVLVFDASDPWSAEDADLIHQWPDAIAVHNKSDVVVPDPDRPPGLLTSALEGDGIGQLLDEVARRLVPNPPAPGTAVPFTARQIHGIEGVLAAVQERKRAKAAEMIGELIG
jgi:tRNA modification GTPase